MIKPTDTSPIEVIPVGSIVYIGDDVPATVMAIWIRANNHVSYECSWWNGRSREEKWVEAFEVHKTEKTVRQKVGFAN